MGSTIMSLTGNEAAAWAGRLARTKVALSFPMGPNAEVTETLQKFIDNGEVTDLKVLYGDNEKASASIQIGVTRLGVRSMLCINSEGVLWASSEIHYAASSRLPMLMVIPSRALEPPTTVYCDHDDFISQRDMGWLMFYCEDSQDVLDTVIQAYRIAEHESVMLPVIVGYEGWKTSHASTRVSVPDQTDVDGFLPAPDFIREEKDYLMVDWKERCTHRRTQAGIGGVNFMDLRYLQKKAEEESTGLIEAVGKEYQDLFGSGHVGLIKAHRCEDAEIVLVSMGTIYPNTRFVVDALRENGVKIGCIKIRMFRPFPADALNRATQSAKLIITLDRNSVAAIFYEIKAALYDRHFGASNGGPPRVMGKVVGVGGKPVTLEDLSGIVEEGMQAAKTGIIDKDLEWLGLRGITFDPTRQIIAE